jgi:hypothetical protein
MCSMNGGQLGRICRAIDELAALPAGAVREAGATGRDGVARRAGQADVARLAAIWEMMADADPELAKRLPGYLSAAE